MKQLLNDPNVLRQLQTLQNFQKFKQDEQQHAMRLQDDIFEQHLQNVLKVCDNLRLLIEEDDVLGFR